VSIAQPEGGTAPTVGLSREKKTPKASIACPEDCSALWDAHVLYFPVKNMATGEVEVTSVGLTDGGYLIVHITLIYLADVGSGTVTPDWRSLPASPSRLYCGASITEPQLLVPCCARMTIQSTLFTTIRDIEYIPMSRPQQMVGELVRLVMGNI
jgi:hypothetical protein